MIQNTSSAIEDTAATSDFEDRTVAGSQVSILTDGFVSPGSLQSMISTGALTEQGCIKFNAESQRAAESHFREFRKEFFVFLP